ncbi:plant basic secretory protein [Guyanagaster necrorhizus]|uniref:Plant basic secretory protein n=1 Tax=Guyanagaster necrorhizus TaxID=856835 RepID=A0A9P8AY69_9AGAR|nr:plant basic secretory protein [Guyanagaster necrorhizus MCA 3950]KAG7452150.1 plant basic secretory protein [Guyanagaster necrorhizus MCA 3950]
MAPTPSPAWVYPTLSLRIPDLAHPGVHTFLQLLDPHTALTLAVEATLTHLYDSSANAPVVGSVVLVLRSMDGVAHTTGSETHKEIHLSVDYIVKKGGPAEAVRHEIMGVLTHEMVHCFQYNARGTCPGGLVEGIADFVRLHADLAPPHWSPDSVPDKWDAGYEHTAYFLDWLENRYGQGTVQELNGLMKDREWDEQIFKELTGRKLGKLWKIYVGNRDSAV